MTSIEFRGRRCGVPLLLAAAFWLAYAGTGAALAQTANEATHFLVRDAASPCLNVRQHPSTGAEVVDCIDPGTRVLKLHGIDGWLKVRMDSGSLGWVAATFLTEASPSPRSQSPAVPPSIPGTAAVSPPPSPSPAPNLPPALDPPPGNVAPDDGDEVGAGAAELGARVLVGGAETSSELGARVLVGGAETSSGAGAEGGADAVQDLTVADHVSPCLNLRNQPGTGSQVMDCLEPGTLLTSVRSIDGWRNVLTPDGLQGWVADGFVTVSSSRDRPVLGSAAGSIPSGSSAETAPAPSSAAEYPSAGNPSPDQPPAVASATSPQEIALLKEVERLRQERDRLENSSQELRGRVQQLQADLARSDLARSELEETLQGRASRTGEAELVALKQKVTALEKQAQDLRRQRERCDEQLAQAATAAAGAARQVTAVEAKLQASAAREAALELQVANLQNSLEEASPSIGLEPLPVEAEAPRKENQSQKEPVPQEPSPQEPSQQEPVQKEREAGDSDAVAAEALATPAGAELPAMEAAVEQVLAWAKAWERQDVAAYLATYSRSFTPPNGASRSAWEAQRRQRIVAPKSIEVTLREVQASAIGEDQARVVFEQTYRSDTFQDVVKKTLLLVREDGAWKIRDEEAEAAAR